MQNFAFKQQIAIAFMQQKKDEIGFPTKKSYNILPPCKISTLFLPCKSVQIEQKKIPWEANFVPKRKEKKREKKLVKGHGGKETVNFVDQ